MDLVLKVSGWKDGGDEGRHKCPFLGQVLKVGDGCECRGHNRRLNLHVHVGNLSLLNTGVCTYVYIHLYMYLYICIYVCCLVLPASITTHLSLAK